MLFRSAVQSRHWKNSTASEAEMAVTLKKVHLRREERSVGTTLRIGYSEAV